MTRNEIINLIREAISLAGDGGDVPFTDAEYDAMYDLLESMENMGSMENIEDKPNNVVSSDDWRGCQGTCDFDPRPNLTGWV